MKLFRVRLNNNIAYGIHGFSKWVNITFVVMTAFCQRVEII